MDEYSSLEDLGVDVMLDGNRWDHQATKWGLGNQDSQPVTERDVDFDVENRTLLVLEVI